MGTAKRERQKEARRARIEAAEAAARQAERRRRFILIGAVVGAVALVYIISAVIGNRSTDTEATTGTTSSTAVSSTTSLATSTTPTAPVTAVSWPAPGASITGDTPCPAPDGSSPRTTSFAKPPPMCIDPNTAYEAKVSTTKGDFTIKLDAAKAPQTVNNFVVLSRYHYFDGIPFHRVIKGFMGQTGDGVGPELGSGPGYQIPDELPASTDEYQRGSVAMANTGVPNSGGSQWFVLFAPGTLATPTYSLFGQVTEGLDTTIAAIEAGGAASDPGTPTDPVYINTITITPAS